MAEEPQRNKPTQAILIAIGLLLLIAISAATVWLVAQSADDSQLVARTLQTQDKLSNVLLAMRRAEAGQRGYLFADDTSYLDDYMDAGPEAEQQMQELRELTAGNPAHRKVLEQIAQHMADKFAEMDATIELNKAGRKDEARALVLSGKGRATMNALRSLVETSIAEEGKLLELRTSQSQRSNVLLLIVTLAGAALIVLVGGLGIALVRRAARQREKAREQLADTNANLEQIVQFRTADLTEANDEIQRFAYIVSHDLRSPLVNIMGFTTELEALRKDIFAEVGRLREQIAGLNAQTATHATAQAATEIAAGETATIETLGKDFDEAVTFIKSSIAKMDRLINAILKLSREGRRQFHPETIDMTAMLESIERSIAHRAAEEGATISFGTLPRLESDRLAIEQIFSNLVDNALKYGHPDRAVRVDIDGSETRAHVIYNVRDNGRGIDPRDHQRVFELFRRSGPQDRPGEGIGLAHVRALVRRLGGTMSLTSEPGTGSVFTVSLPRRWQGESRSAA